MKTLLVCVLTGLFLGPALASAAARIRQEQVQFGKGESRASPATAVFDRTLELQGIRFHVTSAEEGSINTLRIVPSGLEIDNSPIERSINGTVTGAEVADLNVDGSPEIYVYVTSAGSGSYGSLVAYSANRRKSLSEIHLPSLRENKAASKGYMGHDEFAVVESTLVRRFPVYRDDDSNANPTGGMRQLQYKLTPGEVGWLLRLDKVVQY
jgi:Periplasmic lysozyme inhibitor of I-type lysozyme